MPVFNCTFHCPLCDGVCDIWGDHALVCGGGNILRGAEFSELGAHRASADYMGMLATVINGLALSDAIEKQGVETVRGTARIPSQPGP